MVYLSFPRSNACLNIMNYFEFSWAIIAQPLISQTVADGGITASELYTPMQVWLEKIRK